jgi:hypothetical protein
MEQTTDSSAFLLGEYKELRSEILKRSEMQHQLISFALAALGALTAVGLKDSPSAFLAYPILALGLAVGWVHHDLQIAQLGMYIKHRIEPQLAGPGVGWQHAISVHPSSRQIGRLAKFATRGVFWLSELLVVFLYLSRRQGDWPGVAHVPSAEDCLMFASLAATATTFWILRSRDAVVIDVEHSMRATVGPAGNA